MPIRRRRRPGGGRNVGEWANPLRAVTEFSNIVAKAMKLASTAAPADGFYRRHL